MVAALTRLSAMNVGRRALKCMRRLVKATILVRRLILLVAKRVLPLDSKFEPLDINSLHSTALIILCTGCHEYNTRRYGGTRPL